MRGYRNVGIVLAFMLSCCYMSWIAADSTDGNIKDSAAPIAAMAAGTGIGVVGRGLNKKWTNGNAEG